MPLATAVSFGQLAIGRVDTVADFAALEEEWSALFACCAAPHQVFQSFEWLWTWYRHYRDRHSTLAIVTGRIDGQLLAVWPLVVRRRFGLRVLSVMGDPVSQYNDALIHPALSSVHLDALFSYAMTLPADVIVARRVRADAALAPLLLRRLGAPTNIQQAPIIDFTGAPTLDAFERRFSGKLRSTRRRHLRRLEEHGAVTFEDHAPSPRAAALVSTAMAFKRDWARRGRVVAPAIQDPRFERFFAAAASGAKGSPPVRVAAVRCADTVVGVEIAVVCKGRLFGHVLAPCPGWEKQGVGNILAGHAIARALKEGFSAYDTLAPADAYKRDWTSETVAVGDHFGARTLLGAAYLRIWPRFGRGLAKTLLKALQRPGKAWRRPATLQPPPRSPDASAASRS